jgi:hypothetical protein
MLLINNKNNNNKKLKIYLISDCKGKLVNAWGLGGLLNPHSKEG